MSEKKEVLADAAETKEKAEAEKSKKQDKKQKKSKDNKASTDSDNAKPKKHRKITKTITKTTKKVVKKKSSKATDEKPKSTKTKKKSPQTTTKPKKVTTKPAKKAVKKAAPKPKKETTEKKASSKKSSSTKGSKYAKWIFEAITALSTEDKQFVSYEKIKKYLFDYMDNAIEYFIPKQTKTTLDRLHEKGLLKKKKESYALSAKGKKQAPETVEKRKKITGRVDKPKRVLKQAIEEAPPLKEYTLNSGRVSKQRVFET